MWISRAALCICLALAAAPTVSAAAQRFIYTYDPDSPAAKALTDTGLSFEFEKGLLGSVRVRRIIQTGEFGSAELKPASESDLGRGGLKAALGDVRPAGALYEILSKGEGKPFVHAVCPGSDRAWLLIGPMERFRDLKLQAVGLRPGDPGAHACPGLVFSFRSDLRLPDQDVPEARLLHGEGPR